MPTDIYNSEFKTGIVNYQIAQYFVRGHEDVLNSEPNKQGDV